jgi:hypothetical protein
MIVVCNETKMAELLEKHIAELGEAGSKLVNFEHRRARRRPSSLPLSQSGYTTPCIA